VKNGQPQPIEYQSASCPIVLNHRSPDPQNEPKMIIDTSLTSAPTLLSAPMPNLEGYYGWPKYEDRGKENLF